MREVGSLPPGRAPQFTTKAAGRERLDAAIVPGRSAASRLRGAPRSAPPPLPVLRRLYESVLGVDSGPEGEEGRELARTLAVMPTARPPPHGPLSRTTTVRSLRYRRGHSGGWSGSMAAHPEYTSWRPTRMRPPKATVAKRLRATKGKRATVNSIAAWDLCTPTAVRRRSFPDPRRKTRGDPEKVL